MLQCLHNITVALTTPQRLHFALLQSKYNDYIQRVWYLPFLFFSFRYLKSIRSVDCYTTEPEKTSPFHYYKTKNMHKSSRLLTMCFLSCATLRQNKYGPTIRVGNVASFKIKFYKFVSREPHTKKIDRENSHNLIRNRKSATN